MLCVQHKPLVVPVAQPVSELLLEARRRCAGHEAIEVSIPAEHLIQVQLLQCTGRRCVLHY